MKTRLREMRELAGYSTAEEYAMKAGIPVSSYRKYEGGSRSITLEQAWIFADDFGCTIDEIAGHDTTNSRPISEVIASLRSMNEEGQENAANAVKGMAMLPGFKKSRKPELVEEETA